MNWSVTVLHFFRKFFEIVSPKMQELLETSLAKIENDRTTVEADTNDEKESLIRLFKIGKETFKKKNVTEICGNIHQSFIVMLKLLNVI